MTQLTIMLIVPDRARADVMLRADRVYYRFATESQAEDGDLPGLGDRMTVTCERLLDALTAREGEQAVKAEEMKVTVFVDNTARTVAVSEESVARLAEALARESAEFEFLKRFTAE